MSERAKKIFDEWKKNRTSSRDGIAITDARAKETMVITRYGGDVLFAFFDDETGKLEFFFVVQMVSNNINTWNRIFTSLVELKARLIQR